MERQTWNEKMHNRNADETVKEAGRVLEKNQDPVVVAEAEPSSPPSCQAERCGADLGDAKIYHRRHKVCEFHSKAAVVMVSGTRQRFCQQCSRFHELAEFDEAKEAVAGVWQDTMRGAARSRPPAPGNSANSKHFQIR
ncbi:hypothetical protein M0R45_014808 [Rubus argutus]|uniref:SBP-type domain-containing protein n=1 Tax=Rubus argutus TaxID=59490 RepID=A0AAW1XMH8_RUBAR